MFTVEKPWVDSVLSWARNWPKISLVSTFGILATPIGVGGLWAWNASTDAAHRTGVLEGRLTEIDKSVKATVNETIKSDLENISNKQKELETNLDKFTLANEFLSRFYAAQCASNTKEILLIFDQLDSSDKTKNLPKAILHPIYSKVLSVCSSPSRLPKLEIEQLKRIEAKVEHQSCHGDNRFYLGVCYLGKGETGRARELMIDAFNAPLESVGQNSAIPKAADGPQQFADPYYVAMLLLCEILDTRGTDKNSKVRRALTSLREWPTGPIVIDVGAAGRALESIREQPLVRRLLLTNADLLGSSFDDVCKALKEKKDVALVRASGSAAVRGVIEQSVNAMKSKGVLTLKLTQNETPEPATDP